MALVFVSFERLLDEYLVGGMYSICCHMALVLLLGITISITVLAFMFMHYFLVFFICDCLCPFFFIYFFNLVLKRQTEMVNGTSVS